VHRQRRTPKKTPARQEDGARLCWRVRREHGEVLAIEPGETHEHVFAGYDDDYQEALKFAADKLRKELA
jgi:hypothetical protein